MEMEMAPITANVVAAFLDWGLRKACTPSAIASTPVRAVEPEAKALRMMNSDRACSGWTGMFEEAATGQPPRHRARPTASVMKTQTTKPYVGMANRVPASLTPRRFARAMITIRPSAMDTRWSANSGAAETMAMVPAVTL